MLSDDTVNLLDKASHLHTTYREHRRIWLWSSTGVIAGSVAFLCTWDWVHSFKSGINWSLIAPLIMLILSINWGYWTLRLIIQLLNNQKAEMHIIHELADDISDLRKEITKLKSLDHSL